jgi:hypothetical protein
LGWHGASGAHGHAARVRVGAVSGAFVEKSPTLSFASLE